MSRTLCVPASALTLDSFGSDRLAANVPPPNPRPPFRVSRATVCSACRQQIDRAPEVEELVPDVWFCHACLAQTREISEWDDLGEVD